MPDSIGGQCQVFTPPHTVIGGSDIAAESFKNFVADMRTQTQFAQRNAEAWEAISRASAQRSAEITALQAQRSLDFYTLVAFGTQTADQTGQTSNQQTTAPRRTGAADTDSAGSATANRSVDNATAGTSQAAQVGLAGSFQQVLQAISDNNALITKFMAQFSPGATTTGANATQAST